MGGPVPRVKEPHLAGRWYPAAPAELAATVRALLAPGGPPEANVVGLLVPHAAYRYSGPTAGLGYAAAGATRRRVVILAPSHLAAFRGAAVLPMSAYRTPLGLVPIDEATVAELARGPLVRPNPAVFLREHALEIQLPLLQGLIPDLTLVPLLVGSLEAGDAETLAAMLAPLLVRDTLLVVSSDLVHYGRRFDYLPVPPTDAATVAQAIRRLDEGALARIVACDADGFARYVADTGATICGRHPLEVGLRALPRAARGTVVAYTTSLDVTGDHEQVVSYGAVTFTVGAA